MLLDRPPPARTELSKLLSPEESRRAHRYVRATDRDRHIVRRGVLRELLGRYLGASPEAIAFREGRNGKPELADPWCESGIRFNLSHSRQLALYAVTAEVDVGVDVEWVRPARDLDALARRFFSEAEADQLMDVPRDRRVRAFYCAWTRKEAVVKATGEGLSRSLSDFDVTLTPGAGTRLVRMEGVPDVETRWTLVHLEPCSGFVGALATPRPGIAVRRWS